MGRFSPRFFGNLPQNGQVLAQAEEAGYLPPPKDMGRFLKSRQVFYDDQGSMCLLGPQNWEEVHTSSAVETEVKGGACSVTLHLCRRAVAGAIARGLSLHKRS